MGHTLSREPHLAYVLVLFAPVFFFTLGTRPVHTLNKCHDFSLPSTTPSPPKARRVYIWPGQCSQFISWHINPKRETRSIILGNKSFSISLASLHPALFPFKCLFPISNLASPQIYTRLLLSLPYLILRLAGIGLERSFPAWSFSTFRNLLSYSTLFSRLSTLADVFYLLPTSGLIRPTATTYELSSTTPCL